MRRRFVTRENPPFDADRLRRYVPTFSAADHDAIVEELKRIFLAALQANAVDLPVNTDVVELASEWALNHATDLENLLSDSTQNMVRELVSAAVKDGLSPQQLTAALRDHAAFSTNRAETIARTECLPPETPVDAAVIRACFRRWYEGTMVEIITARGCKISTTPNHPMFTGRGWMASGEIAVGDDLIYDAGQDGSSSPRDPNVERCPSTIGQIFDAIAAVGIHKRILGREPDFHGDGRQGDIDVLCPDGTLSIGRFAPLYKPVIDQLLAPADMIRAPICDRCGVLLPVTQHQCICAVTDANAGQPQSKSNEPIRNATRLCDAGDGFPIRVAVSDPACVEVTPEPRRPFARNEFPPLAGCSRQTSGSNNVLNPARISPQFGGDLAARESCLIQRDRVVSIRLWTFRGHVYNLSCLHGYYTIGGGYFTGNTATALGQGQRAAAVIMGQDEKSWIPGNCDICTTNADAGWIGIDEAFPSGDDTIPGHVRCTCTVIYRTRRVHEDDSEDDDEAEEKAARPRLVAEAHCPRCGRWVGRNIPVGSECYCPQHKGVVIAG